MELSGIDFIEVMSSIKKKHRWYLASLLRDIESLLGEDSEEFLVIRKLILDTFNDFLRAVVRIIFGEEIEGLLFR